MEIINIQNLELLNKDKKELEINITKLVEDFQNKWTNCEIKYIFSFSKHRKQVKTEIEVKIDEEHKLKI